MKTVGNILSEERLRKGLTLEQIEKATKIRGKFLKALEEDDYKSLPTLTYIQGFLKNYSDFLGLRSTTILAIFRRQYTRKDRQNERLIEEPLSNSKWQMTPNKVILASVIILTGVFFTYFYLQYRNLHQPPPLIIESPEDGLIVKTEDVAVFGKTDVDATLTINHELVLVKEGGKFYKDIPLTVGSNILQIEAISRVGEKTAVTRTVTRAP